MAFSDHELRARWWAAGIMASAALVALGLVVGAWATQPVTTSPATAPSDGSVDAGFAQDMQRHHAQAVRMSVAVRDATNDGAVRTLALDIMLTQQQQIGQMFAWLEQWRLPQVSGMPMSWMEHQPANAPEGHTMTGMSGMGGESTGGANTGSGAMVMPGMASDDDLRRLEAASGEKAERLYLQLMIPHHQGGVAMARYAADQAGSPQVRALARKIVTSQRAEVGLLRSMLDERGGPVPSA